MEVDVRNTSGQVVDHVEVSDLLFNAPIYEGVVHQALVRQRANERQGTHSTKTRGEARGGGRKPWKQKYTGRGTPGQHPLPAVATWRRRVRTQAARLPPGYSGSHEAAGVT